VSAAPGSGEPGAVGRRGGSRADPPSLVLAGVLLAMGVTLAVDASSIQAPRGSENMGPAAFPWAVAVCLLVLAVVLALVAMRGRPDEVLASAHPHIDEELQAARGDTPDSQPGADRPVPSVVEGGVAEVPVGEPGRPVLQARPGVRVAVFAAGLVAHALLIDIAGYVVAALALFVTVALAFGAPRPVRMVVAGLMLSLVIFYSFKLGLGLALPDFGGR
jgi:putative tricarboxylic transport membrane protein